MMGSPAFERGRQSHHAICTAVLGMRRSLHHLIQHQGRGLNDDLRTSIDGADAAFHQLAGFRLREIDMHAGARTQHKAPDASRKIALDVPVQGFKINRSRRGERRGERKVEAGKWK